MDTSDTHTQNSYHYAQQSSSPQTPVPTGKYINVHRNVQNKPMHLSMAQLHIWVHAHAPPPPPSILLQLMSVRPTWACCSLLFSSRCLTSSQDLGMRWDPSLRRLLRRTLQQMNVNLANMKKTARLRGSNGHAAWINLFKQLIQRSNDHWCIIERKI